MYSYIKKSAFIYDFTCTLQVFVYNCVTYRWPQIKNSIYFFKNAVRSFGIF